MQRQMLKSKVHRATITGCDVDYVGSITLDPELMSQADMLPNEQVHVWDIENGSRFVTYVVTVDSDPSVLLDGVSPDQTELEAKS